MGMSSPTRYCQNCGNPLGPGETFCNNCGAKNELASGPQTPPPPYTNYSTPPNSGAPSPYDPTQMAPSGSSPDQPAYPVPDPYAPPPPPPASPPYGAAAANTFPSYTSPPPTAPPYAAPTVNNFPAYAPYPGAGPVSGPGAFGQPPAPRRRAPVGLIIGIVILLLLLVGGGIFFATRNSGTTGTTTTPVAGTTPTVASTPSPTPTPTPQALFSDSFANNDQGWDLAGGTGFTKAIANNSFTLTDTNKRILVALLPDNKNYDDFMITATMTMQKGDGNDSVGLYLRGDGQLNNDYRVDIFGDSTYAISKEVTGADGQTKLTILADVASSAAIKPSGQPNEITVILKGSTILLQVNGQVVKSVTDTSYTKGQAALFVRNGKTSTGVTGVVTKVATYAAPATLPSA